MGIEGVGARVARKEDKRFITGACRYVDDMVLPRMVFGHVLRSPHAHARIRGIDVARAKAAPGVLAILTGADLRGADIKGADLTGSIFLVQSQVDAAKGDSETTLPASLTHPGHW